MWQESAPALSFKTDAAVVLALGMLISKDGFHQNSNFEDSINDTLMEDPEYDETSAVSSKTSNDAAEESTTTNSQE